jgi:hypothetical protein
MKITIDTKEDSPAEIKHAIELLKQFLSESPDTMSSVESTPYVNMFDSTPTTSSVSESVPFTPMFEDSAPITPQSSPESLSATDLLAGQSEKDEPEEDTPSLIPY